MSEKKLPRKIESQLRELEDSWASSIGDLHDLPGRYRQNIYNHCFAPGNRDGRGISVRALRHIETALRHTRSALKVVLENNRDPFTIKCARKFLKRLAHDSCFEQSARGGRRFYCRLLEDGRRRRENTLHFQLQTYYIGQRLSVSRVRSKSELKKIGRILQCCVAGGYHASRYWNSCIEGNSELWSISEYGQLVALMEIDSCSSPRGIDDFRSRKVTILDEFEADDGFVFSYNEVVELRRQLRIDEDVHDVVVTAGAFDEFIEGTLDIRSPTHRIDFQNKTFDVWAGPNVLILRQAKECTVSSISNSSDDLLAVPDSAVWLRFQRRRNEDWLESESFDWDTTSNSDWYFHSLGELFFTYPHLIEACKAHSD